MKYSVCHFFLPNSSCSPSAVPVSVAWLRVIHVSCFAFASNGLSLAGPKWGPWCVWPCQWANLIGALISVFIQSGESFQVSLLKFRILPPLFDGPNTRLSMLLLYFLGLNVEPKTYPRTPDPVIYKILLSLLLFIMRMTFGHVCNISLPVL